MKDRPRQGSVRIVLAFVVFTALHFALSIASLLIGGGFVMAAFDGNGSAFASSAASMIIDILHFPVVNGLWDLMPGRRGMGTLAQYALYVANSMVWGLTAAIAWTWWRKRRTAVFGA